MQQYLSFTNLNKATYAPPSGSNWCLIVLRTFQIFSAGGVGGGGGTERGGRGGLVTLLKRGEAHEEEEEWPPHLREGDTRGGKGLVTHLREGAQEEE